MENIFGDYSNEEKKIEKSEIPTDMKPTYYHGSEVKKMKNEILLNKFGIGFELSLGAGLLTTPFLPIVDGFYWTDAIFHTVDKYHIPASYVLGGMSLIAAGCLASSANKKRKHIKKLNEEIKKREKPTYY